MLAGKLVLVIFLIVDAAYVGRILRREARLVRKHAPRWCGTELAFPMGAAATAQSDTGDIRARLHEQLDRWLDSRLAANEPATPQPKSHGPRKRRAA